MSYPFKQQMVSSLKVGGCPNTIKLREKSPPPSRGRAREGVETQAISDYLSFYPLSNSLPARDLIALEGVLHPLKQAQEKLTCRC